MMTSSFSLPYSFISFPFLSLLSPLSSPPSPFPLGECTAYSSSFDPSPSARTLRVIISLLRSLLYTAYESFILHASSFMLVQLTAGTITMAKTFPIAILIAIICAAFTFAGAMRYVYIS